MYSDAAFLSATNTPQREALSEWLGYYNVNHPERELIDPLVERLLNDYDAAYALRSILGQKNLSADLKKRLCVSLVEGSRTRTMDRQSDDVDMMLYGNHLSENELKSLISGKGDSTDKAIEKCSASCRRRLPIAIDAVCRGPLSRRVSCRVSPRSRSRWTSDMHSHPHP